MTSAIDSDTLSGLPAAGSNIGGMMKGIAPGAGSLLLTVGLAKGIGSIPGAIAKGMNKRGKRGTKSKKATHKRRSSSLTRYRYNTPLIPKMGPY